MAEIFQKSKARTKWKVWRRFCQPVLRMRIHCSIRQWKVLSRALLKREKTNKSETKAERGILVPWHHQLHRRLQYLASLEIFVGLSQLIFIIIFVNYSSLRACSARLSGLEAELVLAAHSYLSALIHMQAAKAAENGRWKIKKRLECLLLRLSFLHSSIHAAKREGNWRRKNTSSFGETFFLLFWLSSLVVLKKR